MADKILCPWCGAEMKIISNWAEWNDEFVAHTRCWNCQSNGPTARARNEMQAIKGAIEAAMRRYTPPIKPMTLEEVWKEDDPVWVEGKKGALFIGDFYASMSAKNGWDVQTLGSAKPRLMLEDYYGKTWRCWERKPTDEERSAAEWEK